MSPADPATALSADAADAAPRHDWTLLRATVPYRKARPWLSLWQVVSTLSLSAACLALVTVYPQWWLKLVLVLPLAGLLVRIFVLQHDCGHASFFNGRAGNQVTGQLLASITTVPFKLWAAEHQWHHNNQGKLEHRGVDLMNSPMTLAEARNNPGGRQYREQKISALNIFLIGAYSLMVERKFVNDFFLFRKAFRWPIPNARKLRRSIWSANLGSLTLHVVLAALIGWVNWLCVVLPAAFIGAGLGSLLFWVQHNFEDTYFDHVGQWQYNKVGTNGSSYLKLPALLNWFSASIGLHHVHHLNSGIPNYALEAARQGIPALAAVKPLNTAQLRDSFRKIFWDETTGKMTGFTAGPELHR